MDSRRDLILVVEHCDRMRKRIDAQMFNCTSKFARDRLQSKASAYREIEKYVQRLIATSRWDQFSPSNCGESQVDINSMFPSKYLKCSDLQGHNVPVTISHVTSELMGDDEKPVVYFQGKSKGLVLNKTNAHTIASIYGPETEGWTGGQILLQPDRTDFQGRRVDCIRVGPVPQPGQVGGPVGQPNMAPPQQAPAPTPQQQAQAPWEHAPEGPMEERVTKQDMPQRPYSGPSEGEPGF